MDVLLCQALDKSLFRLLSDWIEKQARQEKLLQLHRLALESQMSHQSVWRVTKKQIEADSMSYHVMRKLRAFPMDCLQSSETWHEARAEKAQRAHHFPLTDKALPARHVPGANEQPLTSKVPRGSGQSLHRLFCCRIPRVQNAWHQIAPQDYYICGWGCNLALHGMHFLNPNESCTCGWTFSNTVHTQSWVKMDPAKYAKTSEN